MTLEYFLPIEWSQHGCGELIGRPVEAMPAGFELLSRTSSNGIAKSHRVGACVSLRLPWVFAEAGAIVLDMPVEYDYSAAIFRTTQRAAEIARRRIYKALQGELISLCPQQSGAFGKVSAHPMSAAFAAAAGAKSAGLRHDPRNGVWLSECEATQIEQKLPSGFAFYADAMPSTTTLTVEATTACNFRCGFCYGRHLRQGVLRESEFSALLDNLPDVTAVEFTGEGEPLLNRYTPAMIRLCKEKGLWVHLTSNGSRLTPERAAMVVDLGVDSFAVSLETTDPEEYPQFRPGGRLEELESGVSILRAAIAQRGGKGPRLRLWVSLMRDKLPAVDQFLEYADCHGYEKVEFQTLNTLPSYFRYYSDLLRGQIANHADIVSALRSVAMSSRARKALIELRQSFENSTCHRFMYGLAPNWQGLFSPCCLLKVPDFGSFGDLTRTPLREIWLNDEFRRFRFALQHGAILQSCDGCVNVAASVGSRACEDENLID